MKTQKRLLSLFIAILLLATFGTVAATPVSAPADPCPWPDANKIAGIFNYKTDVRVNSVTLPMKIGDSCELAYYLVEVLPNTPGQTINNMPKPTNYLVLARQIFGEEYVIGTPKEVGSFAPVVVAGTLEGDAGNELAYFYFAQFVPYTLVFKATLDLDGVQTFEFADPNQLPWAINWDFHHPDTCNFPSKFDVLSAIDSYYFEFVYVKSLDTYSTTDNGMWEQAPDCSAGFTQVWLGKKYLTYFVFRTLDGRRVLGNPVITSNYKHYFDSVKVTAKGMLMFTHTETEPQEFQRIEVWNDGSILYETQTKPFQMSEGGGSPA